MAQQLQHWAFETRQLHAGQIPDPATGARAVPIYQTTAFVFDNAEHAARRFSLQEPGNIYGRLTNPTQDVFEQRMASLEGGVAAVATASGAAALSYSFQALAGAGDHIVASKEIYGGTYNLLAHTLPRFGIRVDFVDPQNLEAFHKAILPNTKCIFVETMGNPNATLVSIEGIAAIAHEVGIPLVVDSTFTPPNIFRPIEYGADIVVHSATKFIGGHGAALGGVIIDSGNFDWAGSAKFPEIVEGNPSYHGVSFAEAAGKSAFAVYVRAILLRDTGAAISPFNAFLLLQGLETLSLRVERQVENALEVVRFLASHPKVESVQHPSLSGTAGHVLYSKYFPKGAGSIFSFRVRGDASSTKKFIDSLHLFSLLANVADAKSLVIHPASTTHSQLSENELAEQGVYHNTVRLSIGIEHIGDIIADMENAFSKI